MFARQGLKSIAIPHGKQRIKLVELGLQGKVTLCSQMSEEDIFSEIRSAFHEVFWSQLQVTVYCSLYMHSYIHVFDTYNISIHHIHM